MKNPLTPAGIEPVTFRFVTQLLNHCATSVPFNYQQYLSGTAVPTSYITCASDSIRFHWHLSKLRHVSAGRISLIFWIYVHRWDW